jgi:hypothetical protein
MRVTTADAGGRVPARICHTATPPPPASDSAHCQTPAIAQERDRDDGKFTPLLAPTLGNRERSKRMSDATLDNEPNVSTPSSATSKRGAGYAVYDPLGQKIGCAEELFVNWNEEPEYVRVRIGLFERKSVLIPVQFAEVDDEGQTLVLK